MTRRELIALLGGVGVWPLEPRPQQNPTAGFRLTDRNPVTHVAGFFCCWPTLRLAIARSGVSQIVAGSPRNQENAAAL